MTPPSLQGTRAASNVIRAPPLTSAKAARNNGRTVTNQPHNLRKEHTIMKRTSMRFRHWLLASTLALGLSTIAAVITPGFAQVIPGQPDHLKCYEVIQDQNPAGQNEVDLVNKFGLEPGCHVGKKARRYCTPARNC